MDKPVLVIMAAGMGSRFGGLKQVTPLGPSGELIIDYSIHDALEAGFERIVFVIKHEIEDVFKELIGNRIEKIVQTDYVFQELNELPEGYSVPEGRVKPYGTAHAIMCCRGIVNAPFAVINADDYYGANAFTLIYDFLKNVEDTDKYHYAMVGYPLGNTVTEQGSVARGVCEVDENSMLTDVVERTKIATEGGKIFYFEGEDKVEIDPDNIVSMNFWGVTPSYIVECRNRFKKFLDENLDKNPEKCEFYLPSVISMLINEGKADVKVLDNVDKWYGVTYKEDKPTVVEAFKKLKAEGVYPEKF